MTGREEIIAKLEKEVKRTYAIKTAIYEGGEKVEERIIEHREPFVTITIEIADKILELLKEQEEQIKNRDESLEKAREEIKWLRGMLKEQENLLGIQQTADSITFISTGTAQQGESRGLLLGKLAMHEWLKKELLYRGLLTDDIRAVFDEAKRQEGR